MITAKERFLEVCQRHPNSAVEAATVWFTDREHNMLDEFVLKVNYSEKEHATFLKAIDFTIEPSAERKLCAVIWFDQNDWGTFYRPVEDPEQRPNHLRCVCR